MNRILFTDKVHPLLWESLSAQGFDCYDGSAATLEETERLLPQFDGIVVRSRFRIDEAFLSKATRLRGVARWGVGTEHIDLAAAAAKGIAVLTSPEGSRDTVGEHTIALLLCLMNRIALADRQIRAGQWIRAGNRATELKGKTVGIIGYGNMGQAFAQRLTGFGCRVLTYDKFRINYGDAYAAEADMETIFRESDIVSLHIPYLPENHHLVNHAFLSNFLKPVYVINTARGLVLDTTALVVHLETGKVLGAGLDVHEYEEMSFAHLEPDALPEPFQYLRRAENVVLTPHIAGWSHEAEEGHARVLAGKIRTLFSVH
ncbi:MAG: hydroxyacid dehydrogenase [Saprospiraceae bacterium]|nr:hydroxyacid dehydrogenase [Saprospiraceae bacterium]